MGLVYFPHTYMSANTWNNVRISTKFNKIRKAWKSQKPCRHLMYFPMKLSNVYRPSTKYIKLFTTKRKICIKFNQIKKALESELLRGTQWIFLNSWAIHIETYTWQYNKAIQYVDCSNVVPFWTEQDTLISKKNRLKQGDTSTVQPIALESWTIYLNPIYYVEKRKKKKSHLGTISKSGKKKTKVKSW